MGLGGRGWLLAIEGRADPETRMGGVARGTPVMLGDRELSHCGAGLAVESPEGTGGR
jgi:hypothetical protein